MINKIEVLKKKLKEYQEDRDHARLQETSWKASADTYQLLIEAVYAQLAKEKKVKK